MTRSGSEYPPLVQATLLGMLQTLRRKRDDAYEQAAQLDDETGSDLAAAREHARAVAFGSAVEYLTGAMERLGIEYPSPQPATEKPRAVCGELSGFGNKHWYGCIEEPNHPGNHLNRSGYSWPWKVR